MSVILCPHCGTSNRAGSNFCNACGTDLRSGEDAPPPGAAGSSRREDASPAAPGPASHMADRDQPWRGGEDEDWPHEMPSDENNNEEGEGEQTSRAFDGGATSVTWGAADTPAGGSTAGEGDFADAGFPSTGFAGTDFDSTDFLDAEAFDDEFDDEAEDAYATDAEADGSGLRLITGVQGLLDPIRVSRQLAQGGSGSGLEEWGTGASRGTTAAEGAGPEKLRRFRELFSEEPRLAGNRRRLPPLPRQPVLWIPWLFLAVAVLVGVPLVLGLGGTGGTPPEWPGVAEAHAAIDGLAPDAVVLLYWAYDPATAGELDLAARPVLRHLLERRARLVGVSPLPAGPATARRVVEQIRQSRAQSGVFSLAGRNPWPVIVEYLPGGTGALPLVATQLGTALGPIYAPTVREVQNRPPVLAVVLAAQAEDVQHWLEQVQTRNGTPVVAVVSAGADPILRPYWDSGQLRGLVSGFDGAFHYQARLDPQESRADGIALRSHAAGQNWAHLAILLALVLGNLAAIVGRSAGRE